MLNTVEGRINVINDKLKMDLGVTEEPRYSWSLFPHWKEKIGKADRNEAQALKLEYLLELKDSLEMKQMLIANDVPHLREVHKIEIKKLRDQIEGWQKLYNELSKEYRDFGYKCAETLEEVIDNLKKGHVNDGIRQLLTLLNHDSMFIKIKNEVEEVINELDEPIYKEPLLIKSWEELSKITTKPPHDDESNRLHLFKTADGDDIKLTWSELIEVMNQERGWIKSIWSETPLINNCKPTQFKPTDEDLKPAWVNPIGFIPSSSAPMPLINNCNPTQPNPDSEKIREIQDQVVKSCEEEYKAYLEWKKTKA